MLAGVVGPKRRSTLAERQAAREGMLRSITEQVTSPKAVVPTHSTLLRRFEEKVAGLQAALDDRAIRNEAAETTATLIERVIVHWDAIDPNIAATTVTSTLLALAQNENSPCRRSDRSCS